MFDLKAKKDWKTHWTKKESIEESNHRIHCNAPIELLYERGKMIHTEFFNNFFPGTQPKNGSHILDVGIGVGWPMQALVDLIPDVKVTGLDISQSMINNTKKRLFSLPNHKKYEKACDFKHYDGETFPLNDNTFDAVYSYAVLWHVPELVLGKMLKEMIRVLKPGGRGFLQFLIFDSYKYDFDMQYDVQIKKQLEKTHFHFYYSLQNLIYLITEVAGGVNFDIVRSNSSRNKNGYEHYTDLHQVTFTKSETHEETKIVNEKIRKALGMLNEAI